MVTGMVEGVAEWRHFCRSLREPQAHGAWLTPADTVQASTLSLFTYVQLTRPVNAFLYSKTRATPAQHNYAYHIMHPPLSGENGNYLDVALGLQPQTTTQLQGNELRPRAIHYDDDTVLLFPQLPFLFCLLFFDALSHHVYVILFVSVKPEAERQQRRATRWHHKTRRQRKTNRPDDDSDCERPSQLSTSILPTHTKKPLHCRVHVPVEAVRVAD